jgi:predicted ATPase/DNA-binding winged helix-turn-helix (wHTH) protein
VDGEGAWGLKNAGLVEGVEVSEQPVQESAGQVIAFGPFRLHPAQRLVLKGDTPVHLGSRACEILMALVEKHGQVVGKRELLARVWPDTIVEEASLRVHIAALRRALGDGGVGRRYITNVPGRGYSFVAPISVTEAQAGPAAPQPPPSQNARQPSMPLALARMVGRSGVVSALAEQLSKSRFVTVVGPGGLGKTTVALAVADRLRADFTDGVHFVDLAPLTDSLLVPSTLAAQLGIGAHAENPLPGLIAFLREKNCLIVLDSCEHVIEAAATLAEEIVGRTSRMRILATSREALRAEGEHVHRLSPLGFPTAAQNVTAAGALDYPAVQLFVDRVAASLGSFELADGEAPVVAEICRRLDGIPLAIEMAASRVDTFGVAGLAAGLNDRFQLLMQGRRTALPRHRTLSATLDWSYSHLSETERLVLRQLSAFVGAFTMEAASEVLGQASVSPLAVIDAVANLVAKSLVWADVGGATAFYRLSDATRAYALAKLEESGERHPIARAHAGYYRAALEKAQIDWETRSAGEWLLRHRHLMDNARAALDWAFSPAGDAATGVAITLGSVPLWFGLSLTKECVERVDRALAAFSADRDPQNALRLYATRAWSLMQTLGSVPATQDAWTRVLELSEDLGDVDYELRALWGLWSGLLNSNDFRAALELAERFSAIAKSRSSSADVLIGERMIGYIVHLMGDQTRARRHIERMLGDYVPPLIGAQVIRFVFDQRATAQCFLARILWLQGCGDQAVGLSKEVVETASARGDGLSLCQALVQGACPVALFVGDLDALERYVSMLLDYSDRHALDFWQAFGRCFQSALTIRRGHLAEGLGKLGSALDRLREIRFGVYYGAFLSEFADALARSGRPEDGRRAIDEALARAERNEERWYQPELLRIKGEIALRQGLPNAAEEAEMHFLESLDWSRRQETIAWRLRTATSLASLYVRENRMAEAREALAPVQAAFTEGLATADLRAAKALLDRLPGGRRGRGGKRS